MMPHLDLVLLAAVALFVLYKLYGVLGQPGERDQDPSEAFRKMPVGGPSDLRNGAPQAVVRRYTGPASEGLAAIGDQDETFDQRDFMAGARTAHEMIIRAYTSGDVATLKAMLTPDVFAAFSAAIRARTVQPPEYVGIRMAEVVEASLVGALARVSVRFETDMDTGAEVYAQAKEVWTFERRVNDSDPNWKLAGVAPVTA